MTTEWCTEVVREAIQRYGQPEIKNTYQGSQFTSEVFTGLLKASSIQISMDGISRAIDNIYIEWLWQTVKYKQIYLNVPEEGVKLYEKLNDFLLQQ